ncbi:MAG: hypothetical protein GY772_23405, partial [bacterium]|nr:hypothetical protein [bacterium]
ARLGPDCWSCRVIREGFRPLLTDSPSIPPPSSLNLSPAEVDTIDTEVANLLKSSAIAQVDPTAHSNTPPCYSSLFCVRKRPTGWRPCLNLRPLNRSVVSPRFSLPTIRTIAPHLSSTSWMAKVDLKSAYFHMPMATSAQPLLRFQWRGNTYQFRVLPFGLSSAPWAFTRFLRPLLPGWAGTDAAVFIYLDDILVLAPSRRRCARTVARIVNDCRDLALTVNSKKSVLTPPRSLEYLGFVLDADTLTVSLPRRRLLAARRAAASLLHSRRPVHVAALARFVGHLEAASSALFAQRAASHHVRGFLSRLTSSGKLRSPLPHSCRSELKWWLQHLHAWNGSVPIPPAPSLVLETDAAPQGWGACLRRRAGGPVLWSVAGRFSAGESRASSNQRELRAVLLSLRALSASSWAPRPDTTILLRSDNTTTLSYLRRLGGKVAELASIAATLARFLLRHRLHLRPAHIPGVHNTVADLLSRLPVNLADARPSASMRRLLRRRPPLLRVVHPYLLHQLPATPRTLLIDPFWFRRDPTLIYALAGTPHRLWIPHFRSAPYLPLLGLLGTVRVLGPLRRLLTVPRSSRWTCLIRFTALTEWRFSVSRATAWTSTRRPLPKSWQRDGRRPPPRTTRIGADGPISAHPPLFPLQTLQQRH